jgi:hypothetical protein
MGKKESKVHSAPSSSASVAVAAASEAAIIECCEAGDVG